MSDAKVDDVPDLRTLLAEATRPWAEVTIPLNQAIRTDIERAEQELSLLAADAVGKRMASASPVKAKAREIEELRAKAAASAITLRFDAPTEAAVDSVRKAMAGRDDADEYDLRLTAVTCTRVTDAQGREFGKVRNPDPTLPPEVISWTDLRKLRDDIGFPLYEASIKDASDKVYRRDWSVPFSFAASHILGTET